MKALHAIGKAVALAIVFAAALVAGVLWHLDMPVARRFVIARVNAALATTFDGRLTIDEVRVLGLAGIDGASAHVDAADGTRVLSATGIRARTSAIAIARSALGSGDIAIALDDVAIDSADASLDGDAAGIPKLAGALRPRASHAPSAPGGRGVRLDIARFVLRHGWAHGAVAGGPPLDVDVDDARGSVHVLAGAVTVDVDQATIKGRAMPGGLDPIGRAHAHVARPSATGQDVGVDASFEGAIGGIPAAVRASKDGARVDASLDVPRATPASVRARLPEVELAEDVALHAEAHGELPALAIDATATMGGAAARAHGALVLGDPVHATVTLDARAVDLRALTPKAPATSLSATGQSTLTVAGGVVTGDFTLDGASGRAGSNAVPPVAIKGNFRRDERGLTVRGNGRIAEDGANADVTFTLRPEGRSSTVDFTARASVPRLDKIGRIGPVATGSAEARAAGKVRLDGPTLDATLDADLRDVASGDRRLARGRLHVNATGPLSAPSLDSTLTGEDLDTPEGHFSRVRVAAQGPPSRQHVDVSLDGAGAPDVRGSADVGLGAATTLRDVRLTVTRDDVTMTARVASARVVAGELQVEDAVVEGLGTPAHAELHVTSRAISVRAHARGVALTRIARLLRLEATVRAGKIDYDVDLMMDPTGATGHILFDVSHASIGKADDLSAHVEVTMQGRRGALSAHVALGDVGYADVKSARLAIGGHEPLTLQAWRRAWGKIDLDAKIDLAKVYAMLPDGSLPIAGMSGMLLVKGETVRDAQTDFTPELSLSAHTESLALQRKGGDAVKRVDVELAAKVDGSSGAAAVAARLVDEGGAFATIEARSDAIPYRELLTSNEAVVTRLEAVPLTAKLVVPPRAIAKLPAGLGVPGAHGEVGATLDFDGSVRAPRVTLEAGARGVAFEDSPLTFPIDVALVAHYDGHDGDAAAEVRSPHATVLEGSAHVKASVDDLLARAPGADVPWQGSTRLRLSAFPLASITMLSDRGVRGRASGEITIDGLHDDGRAKVDLALDGLQVGMVKYTDGKLALTVDDRGLRATARVDQTDGFAEANATMGLAWGRAIVPAIDPTRPLDVSLKAKSFRAEGLMPIVGTVFSELEGRLDADASVRVDAAGKSRLEGSVVLSDGLFQLASTGTELHGAKAKLVMTPDGTVRLDDVTAYGVTGLMTGSGVAHVQGTRLVDASGSLTIPKGQPIPLDVRGSQLGEVYGEVSVKARRDRDPKIIDLDVDVPHLHVELPLVASHAVLDREPLPNVHVGIYGDGRFTKVRLDGHEPDEKAATSDGTQLVVSVHLGQDIEVKQGTKLKVGMDGNPVIKVGDKSVVTGQIRLKNGTLDVQGKKFEIEKGTVTFVGTDPSNPQVVVTAGWTAADGTRVYADFAGPLKTGKVSLRSEPTRPKNEILALILFGSADGSASTPYSGAQGDTAARAGGAAGGLATEGLTRGIDELTGLDVATKIDTSNASSPRPEVEVQIARSISLQVAFVLGTPPPGSNPDTTFATIDWRFSRRWSLATTFGDKGSSFADVIWQYRY